MYVELDLYGPDRPYPSMLQSGPQAVSTALIAALKRVPGSPTGCSIVLVSGAVHQVSLETYEAVLAKLNADPLQARVRQQADKIQASVREDPTQ